MSGAYYNEFDPFAAAWLRQLIRKGLIADGDVDERSISEVTPNDLKGYMQCHFFAGIGGWSHALRLAGWPDDRPVWTGSPPCQPFSSAGLGKGVDDERHLAPVFLDLVRECRPATVFGEQVATAVIKDGWLDSLFDALEDAGYACGAAVAPACSVGAPHIRQRLWFTARWVGDSKFEGLERHPGYDDSEEGRANESGSDAATSCADNAGKADIFWRAADWLFCRDGKWRPVEPGTFPMGHGLPARVGRLRGYGNAIVPQVAAEFIRAAAGWPA